MGFDPLQQHRGAAEIRWRLTSLAADSNVHFMKQRGGSNARF
jgi:hypothetical protein